MIALKPPIKSLETLNALALSGVQGIALKAKAEIARRTLAGLKAAVKPS